jgi:hypothetical protein
MRKLIIDKNLGLDDDRVDIMSNFCNFCADFLEIEESFQVRVVSDKVENRIQTTAYYSPSDGDICIYGKNRALVDICRSIAHEMTHMRQDEQGLITGKIQDAGGFHEDQANSKAGEIIKRFARDVDDGRKIYESKYIKLS